MLYVYGHDADRAAFVDDATTSLDLNRYVPCEENAGIFEQVEKWGTKWGCYNIHPQRFDRYDAIYFETAWEPFTLYVFNEIDKAWPRLHFKLLYIERGQGIAGMYIEGVVANRPKNLHVMLQPRIISSCPPECTEKDADWCDTHEPRMLDHDMDELYSIYFGI